MFISAARIRFVSVLQTSQKMEVKFTSRKDAKIKSHSLDFKFAVIEHVEEYLLNKLLNMRESKEEIGMKITSTGGVKRKRLVGSGDK